MNAHAQLGLITFGFSAAVTALTLPLWRAGCRKTGLVDEPGHRKLHGTPMPLAGGWALLTGIVACLMTFVFALRVGWLDESLARQISLAADFHARPLLVALTGAVGMFLVGAFDDRLELRPWPKSLGQLIVAMFVAAVGPRITLFVPSPVFSFAITVLWILAVTNAFNFSDNMNGLCCGLGLISAVWLGLIATRHGQSVVAGLAFAVGGAAAGFLPYNYPRAVAFLGDAGSHLIGYLLAVLTILPSYYSIQNPRPVAVLTPLVLLAVPLLDLIWVVLLRWRSGKPFYVGDTNHLSHQLVRRGFSPAPAVAVLWLAAALIGGLSLYWN